MADYLDCIAKSLETPDIAPPSGGGGAFCGGWAAVGSCALGHAVARTILCGREWCEDCGQKDSDAHRRRWARWLPKARQMRSMGYLVVTFPPAFRAELRTKTGLSDAAKRVTNLLRSLGFSRGLRRWHFFGDESTTYHPHLNYLLDSGRITKAKLESIKVFLLAEFGFDCVIHYQYTTVPAKMMHLLKYVTRPTFLQREWDHELADALYNCRITWAWGKWDTPVQWAMDSARPDVTPQAQAVLRGTCPHCGGELAWARGVTLAAVLKLWPRIDYGLRIVGLDWSGLRQVSPLALPNGSAPHP